MQKGSKAAAGQPSYVTLNKDGKAVWEPGLRAEVTSRRRHPVKKKVEEPTEAPVVCDLKITLKMDPTARAQWLERALAAIPKGRVKPQEVFDIITHRKFGSGIPDDLGPQMLRVVKESLMFFSEKQQLNIAKCKFVKEFKPSDASSSRRKRRHDDDSDSDGRSSDDGPATGSRRFQEADRRDEDRRRGDDSPPPPPPSEVPGLPPMPDVPREERERMEREFAEREAERAKKREEELKRLEAERKAHEERERIRKAKIGNAFLMGGEDEEEVPASVLARQPLVEKKYEDRRPQEEEGIGYFTAGTGSSGKTDAAASAASLSAIQTMGGDSIVNEAQAILQKGAGVFLGSGRRKSRSRSRRRRSPSSSSQPRKKERRNDRKDDRKDNDRGGRGDRDGEDTRRRRTWDSLRSPTPDGHLRGQMRAARKAKMMAQMLQQGNVPRVA